MTSSQHAPYILGYTRNTMVETIGSKLARGSESGKLNLSSDCRLQLAYMKLESLVIAGQLYGGEYVPQFCTYRPSRGKSRKHPKELTLTVPPTATEEGYYGEAGNSCEVVTRYSFWKEGVDHLLFSSGLLFHTDRRFSLSKP